MQSKHATEGAAGACHYFSPARPQPPLPVSRSSKDVCPVTLLHINDLDLFLFRKLMSSVSSCAMFALHLHSFTFSLSLISLCSSHYIAFWLLNLPSRNLCSVVYWWLYQELNWVKASRWREMILYNKTKNSNQMLTCKQANRDGGALISLMSFRSCTSTQLLNTLQL